MVYYSGGKQGALALCPFYANYHLHQRSVEFRHSTPKTCGTCLTHQEMLTTPNATSGSLPLAQLAAVTELQAATDRLVRYATRGTGKQVEPPLTEALSEVEAFCSSLEGLLAHGFKTRQFLLFTVHPWAFVEHSEKFGELNAEAVRLP